MLNPLRQRLAAAGLRGRAPPRLPLPPLDEVCAFLDVARSSFVGVQQAWDRADLALLAMLTTEPLFDELRRQLAERGAEPNHTEVLEVDARLLALDELHQGCIACVEFCGRVREQPQAQPVPFRELWMFARLQQADARWRLARVQALC